MITPQNILIIDDVSSNLVALAELVRNAGYLARPVTNARQAVNAIEVMVPSLILMDVSMPEIDGFVFCSMLKKNLSTREIPVIMISVLDSTEDKIKGFMAGAVDYIIKPYSEEEVALRIKLHLNLYKSRNDAEENNLKLCSIINDQIKKLYEAQKNVLETIVLLMKRKYSLNSHYFDCVAKTSKIVAKSLQLTSKFKDMTSNFIDAMEQVAPLHDLGMDIMGGDCPHQYSMTDTEESDQWKAHTEIGADYLKEIFDKDSQNEAVLLAMNISKYHHEKWDGTGYPEGLSGSRIPICARIATVTIAYTSLIRDSFEDRDIASKRALEYINHNSGVIFDPDIVDVVNKIHYQLKVMFTLTDEIL